MPDRYAAQAQAIVAEWIEMGAPLPTGQSYNESTRQSIREWAEGRGAIPRTQDGSRQVLRYVLHFVEQAKVEAAQAARLEAIHSRARRRLQDNTEVAEEMAAIRSRLDLSQSELNAYLRLKPGTIKNAENPHSGYSLDARKELLEAYRAAAKMAGKAPKAAKAKA